jgi:hypothetical protein
VLQAHEDYYTIGSQKVPGMVVLHCNGGTYSNAYVTFKVGLLCVCASILPLLDAPAEGTVKRVPLRPIFRVVDNRKSLGVIFGEDGTWMVTSDVWLSVLL